MQNVNQMEERKKLRTVATRECREDEKEATASKPIIVFWRYYRYYSQHLLEEHQEFGDM